MSIIRASALVILSFILLATTGCRRQDTLFETVPATQSGIAFTNTLHKAPLFNILYYLYYYNGGGVATGDINNDGLADIYFTANHKSGNKLYLNKGNFTFEDITDKAGVAGNADWSTGATMADVNGDGLLDIYVCAASSNWGLTGGNTLFINKGNLSFADSTAAYGLQFSGLSTQAAFFDYDHDGDLDCYQLNHSKKPHANVVDTSNRRKYDPMFGDRLYRQDQVNGATRFTDVSAQAGIYQSSLGYGLGLAVADFNNDGWEDIYVGNDFHENDYYYLNNHDGSFSESGAKYFGHYSRFSMGNDAADFNNDGNTDIITVDMLPPDEKTLKTYGSDENPTMYKVKLGLNGYQNQYSRNCLQVNNGNGSSFSETALISGMPATDWSWSPLFADFDNDGNKDLFISSGIVKRPVDLDYVQFVSAMQTQKGLESTDKFDEETIEKMPDGATHPFFFKGDGRLRFEEVSKSWGTSGMKGYFNGAAYADLDNDGDLDMVINCIDAKATLLRNNTKGKQFATIVLQGEGKNTQGIGAKVWLFSKKGLQYQQAMATRGFQSASDTRLHFGLDSINTMDSLLIVWPDQRYQVIRNVAAGKSITLKQSDAQAGFVHQQFFASPAIAFETVPQAAAINWKHQENEFVDFNRQYLIPHAQSTRGPKMAVADVNGDGLDDVYVCGARGQAGALLLQQSNGNFTTIVAEAFQRNASCEENDAIFFDANGDTYTDLYVVSGGNEFSDGAAELSDHLYLNDGKGNFQEAINGLPEMKTNKSCAAAADVDGDGDQDLFVGGLANAIQFGYAQRSFLLLNNGSGKFTAADGSIINLDAVGMVTDAAFADMNGDKRMDLVMAGEWMPVKIALNQGGRFAISDLPASTGLWQSIFITDINNDGQQDILAGNWGLNSKLACGKDGPLKMYVKDFDANGSTEQVVAYTVKGKEYPFLAKDELERALPVLKKAYLSYHEVAGETVQYMFYDLFKNYAELKAETLASTLFLSQGKQGFKAMPLPDALQLAPIFQFERMGNTMMAVGNFYGTVPYEGRYDALKPTLFAFNSAANGIAITNTLTGLSAEWRDAKWISSGNNHHLLLLAENNGPVHVMHPTAPTILSK